MFGQLFTALLALLITGSAHAQVSAPNCSDYSSNYTWSYNSLGQSPCLVAAHLAAVCNNGAFSISPLFPQHSYSGPSTLDDANPCKCNTVVYNLISACDACQGEPWVSYSSWSHNCSSVQVATPGTFPEAIPVVATQVPHWAYLNLTGTNGSDFWNISSAQRAGGTPTDLPQNTVPDLPQHTVTTSYEVTVTVSPVVPSSSSTITPSSPSKGNSNAGAIAGGVVGGVVGVALMAGLVTWFTIRRRRRHAPSAEYFRVSGRGSDMGVVLKPTNIGTLKLYDPSDPSTYPTSPTSTTHLSDSIKQYLGSSSGLQPNRKECHGLPEI